MRVAIGADHRGAPSARDLADWLGGEGYEVIRVGNLDDEPCDYPERAFDVGSLIASGSADRGILVCGTGIGMSIAANKVAGVRAALASDEMTARLSRSHNDANVICLSADLIGTRLLERLVDVFLKAEFEGGRHARRVEKIGAIEQGRSPAASQA